MCPPVGSRSGAPSSWKLNRNPLRSGVGKSVIGTPHGEGRVVDLRPLRDAVIVLVGEEYHEVARPQIEPLEELEALKKKAEAGCSKHEGGGCDCGAKTAAAPDEAAEAE